MKKRIHPAVSEYYRQLQKKSRIAFRKKLIEKSNREKVETNN